MLSAVPAQWRVGGAVIGAGDVRIVGGLGVDVELVEAQVVESPAVVVGQGAVELARVGQEVEQGGDPALGGGVVDGVGFGEALVDPVAFEVDVLDLLGEFRGGPVRVADQFEVGVFAVLKAGQLGSELLSQLLGGGLLGPEHFGEGGADLGLFGFGDGDGRVVGLYGGFDDGEPEPWKVALPALAANAAVVEVVPAVPAAGGFEDEAAPAAGAPEQPFEVVSPGAFAGAAMPAGEDFLDLREQVGIDQWLVASGVLSAFPDDIAEVAAVAQDLLQLAR